MNNRVYYSENARQRAQRKQLIIVMAVAGISLGVGVIVSLLFAPDSGENVRSEIRDQLEELIERGTVVTRDAVDGVSQQAQHVREEGEDKVKSARK